MKTFRIHQLALKLMDAKFLQASCNLRCHSNVLFFPKTEFELLRFQNDFYRSIQKSQRTHQGTSKHSVECWTCKNQPLDSADGILNSSSANGTQKCVLFFNPTLKGKYWIVIISKWCKLGSTLVPKAEVQQSQYEQDLLQDLEFPFRRFYTEFNYKY